MLVACIFFNSCCYNKTPRQNVIILLPLATTCIKSAYLPAVTLCQETYLKLQLLVLCVVDLVHDHLSQVGSNTSRSSCPSCKGVFVVNAFSSTLAAYAPQTMAMVRRYLNSISSGRYSVGGRTTVRLVRTLRTRRRISSFAPPSATGMPLSTSPFAKRSRTCLSCVYVEPGEVIPLIRSIHELTLIFSLLFIILSASSSRTSPPLRAYEMLSFQKERGRKATCLSLRPISRISSISVNLGCLSLSALSLISRGSKAILCPFAPLSYDVSRPPALFSSLRLLVGAGELTRLPSSLSRPAAGPAPPLLLVKPELEAILGLCSDVVCLEMRTTPGGASWPLSSALLMTKENFIVQGRRT
ncbi:vacuolar protein sorting-associated protein 74, partial [Aureobasidium melanogenum]